MAKKTPVKKPKRRLKRSVRRSLAAVLMITAIGVAAIPVPENYAEEEYPIMPLADNDPHEQYIYGSPKGDDEKPLEKIILSKYKNASISDLIKNLAPSGVTEEQAAKNFNTYQSLIISEQSNGLMLRWEFVYYLQEHPKMGGYQGVICKYNDSYEANEVKLNFNPYTGFYTVEEEKFDNYFTLATDPKHTAAMSGMNENTDPGEAMEFTYQNYLDRDSLGEPAKTIQQCMIKYFEDDYNYFINTTCPEYEAALAEWKNSEEQDPALKPKLPLLSITPALSLDSNRRYEYFCDYDKKLSEYGSGYELIAVQDGRAERTAETEGDGGTAGGGGNSGNSSIVYVAHAIDKSKIESQKAAFDDNGFLVTAKGKAVCAIGDRAFYKVSNVNILNLPSEIGYIGDEAFQDSFIQEIGISSVEFIGNRAFQRCSELRKVTIGIGTSVIGAECFESSEQIAELSLPYSVSTIGYGAFANCKGLTSLDLNVISTECVVKEAAFYNCSGLTGIKMDTSNIRSLGKAAFAVRSESRAMDIVLPTRIPSKYRRSEKDKDSENVNVNVDYDGLGDYLFAGRTSLKSVVMPREYGSAQGDEVKLPSSIFHGCINLEYVEFPADWQSAPYIGSYVSYDGKDKKDDKYIIFADVLTENFYVRGPEKDWSGKAAAPRQGTWSAKSGNINNNTVPYIYKDSKGVEFYEVSDGNYLLCVNQEGILVSCQLIAEAIGEGSTDQDIEELIIPRQVGTIRVKGIKEGCFSDKVAQNTLSITIEDDSISAIDNAVFQGTDKEDSHPERWQKVKSVYIGNSVTSIGNDAFRNCRKLVDVTFGSPDDHSALTIGTDAFTTGSSKLTFHGDIVKGYAPFKWATDSETVINKDNGLRICYKSLAPTYLTVMYNPITKMVTLLDYPKYEDINSLLQEAYKDEIEAVGERVNWVTNYQKWREYTLYYTTYYDTAFDGLRQEFAKAWMKAINSTDPDNPKAKDEAIEAVYASKNYGPWVNPDFCSRVAEWQYGNPDLKVPEDDSGRSMTDWLFEPITAYAADSDIPDAYYDHGNNGYVVTKAVDKQYANPDYYPSSPDEQALVDHIKNIDIPAGVESIDVYGYLNDKTADGEDYKGSERNTMNRLTYLTNPSGWDEKSTKMYEGDEEHVTDEKEKFDIVPGLFSGYYEDGDAAPIEERGRGNDVIKSVTMHSVKYLPDYAFDSCESLWYVVLGDDCKNIGRAPFRGCDNLSTIVGNDYYTADNGIIYSRNSDGTLTIEECLSGRGKKGVLDGGLVNQFNDPNILLVSDIKPGAFEDCDYVTMVDFGSNDTAGLLEIPEDCFRNCDSLTGITLPMTVNDVGPGAFVGSNRLMNLTIYGKEVKISGEAFRNIDNERTQTSVRTYPDSAVVRYVKEYGNKYDLLVNESQWLGEVWQVSFYDANFVLIEDLQKAEDEGGGPLDNPQYVNDGEQAIRPKDPESTDDWTFQRWVGMNNVGINDRIHENASFYAQGYSTSGMVDGKWPVTFWDGVAGTQVGPIQYIPPGNDAIKPDHPVHAGYIPAGTSEPYTNIQKPMTIILRYDVAPTSGGGTSGGTTGTSTGTTSTTSTTSNKSNTSSTSNTSNTSNTSSSNSTSSTKTSSSNESTQALGMYVVTVIGGSGSGTYAPGTTVLIAANTPAAGSQFSKWVTESQGVSLASVSTTPTTFTMPANNVTITAEYTAAATPTSATGGTGRSGNDNGSTRVDITKPGISNKDLATANVNGSTDNFVVKITETDEATRAVQAALTNKYGTLDNLLYYAMDISLYDSTGTVKITDTSGLSVDLTIPIPDALVAYGGNNMAGAVVNGDQLESLNENFTTINGVPCIRFTATHFSPYTIYVDTGNLTEGMLDTTPKTGDPIHPKWFLSIGLACLSVILFLKKDKNVKAKTA